METAAQFKSNAQQIDSGLKQLHDLLDQEKAHIINFDLDNIWSLNETKLKLMTKLMELEDKQRRIRLVWEKKEADEATAKDEMQVLQDRIKARKRKIRTKAAGNQTLIEQSRLFLNDLVGTVLKAGQHPSYGPRAFGLSSGLRFSREA